MKALLLKDFYVLVKSLKYFILLLAVFALVPQIDLAAFALVYMSVLTVSALSYDERCKWNSLAAAMPFTSTQLVVSKYLLGLIGVGCTVLLAVLGTLLLAPRALSENLMSIALCAAAGLVMMSLSLPIMYRFGTEKGRIALLVFVAVVVSGSMLLYDKLPDLVPSAAAIGAIVLASLAFTALSAAVSVRIYQKKEK